MQKVKTRTNGSVRKNKRLFMRNIIFVTILLWTPFLLFAEIQQSVDLSLTSALGYSSIKLRDRGDNYDYMDVLGNAKLAYTLSGRGKLIRSQARLAITGTESVGILLELTRAYIRTRVPIGNSYNLQLELGKNSLTWGEGSYYNAGDVIFGSSPKTTDLSSINFRDYAFWQFRMFIPITDFVYLESVVGIPDQLYKMDSISHIIMPSSNIESLGAGLRFHAETGFLQWELGGYSRFVSNKISPYISIALPLKVRTYVATSTEFDFSTDAENMESQLQETTKISGGMLVTRSVGNEGSIIVQPELMYQNYLWNVQLNMSWFFRRTLGLVLRGDVDIYQEVYSLLLGPQWLPEEGFTLSMFSVTSVDVQEQSNNNAVHTKLMLSMQYKW